MKKTHVNECKTFSNNYDHNNLFQIHFEFDEIFVMNAESENEHLKFV